MTDTPTKSPTPPPGPKGWNYTHPTWLPARKAGRLSCGHDVGVGELITFLPATRRTECNACSHKRAVDMATEGEKVVRRV